MKPRAYDVLPQRENDCSQDIVSLNILSKTAKRRLHVIWALSVVLVVSLVANAAHFYGSQSFQQSSDIASKYAHLHRDVPLVRARTSIYDSTDRQVQDAAWGADLLKPENGFVALDDDYTESMGLPHAQRSPWYKHKGIYVISSSHELHCVHVLRDVTNQAYDETTLMWEYGHVLHCLNVLRETIMCNADDEPLYTGPLHIQAGDPNPRAGVGFTRMCRDWNKLQAWGREHSACWAPYEVLNRSFPEIERYKFCPDGSMPWEHLEENNGKTHG